MFYTILGIAFGIFLWSFMLLAVCSVAFILIQGTEKIIQAFFPDAMIGAHEKENRVADRNEKHERKLLAIDFIMQERIRRQVAFKRGMEERLSGLGSLPDIRKQLPDEVSLEEISHLVKQFTRETFQVKESDTALYCIVRIVDGHKRFLCRKGVRRDSETHEIKTHAIFAALKSEAIKLDLQSATRLATVLPDATIEPANAAARIYLKLQNDKLDSFVNQPFLSTSEGLRLEGVKI